MNSVVPRDVAYKSSVDFKNPVLLQKFDRLFRTQTVTKKQATLMIARIWYNFWNSIFRKHEKFMFTPLSKGARGAPERPPKTAH